MRKVLLTGIALITVLFIAGCTSKEEQEVLDFHNDWVDDVNKTYLEVGDIEEEISMLSDEEAFEKIEQEMIPRAEEVEKFFDDYEVGTEPATEYYDLRKSANDEFVAYIVTYHDAAADYLDGTISEDEFGEILMNELIDHYDEFLARDEKANQRWDEIFDEYGFEEIKE